MTRAILIALLLVSCVAWRDVTTMSAGSSALSITRVAPPQHVVTFVEAHCVACHNDRALTGGLSLSADTFASLSGKAETWEKVLHKIRTGQMPPANRPRPAAADVTAITTWLQTTLDTAADLDPQPGRVGAHRLNRTEYTNAIRDLFSLQIDAAALLLPDEAEDGFDNVAASLALSPSHLERYLAAARHISRMAVGDRSPETSATSQVYRVPRLLDQDVRVHEDLPFGSRGGLVVRHHFARDGEYAFRVRLRRQIYDYIVGMRSRQQLELRLDGALLKRFTVGGEAKGTPGPLTWNGEIVGETEYELYMHAADAGLEVRVPVTAGVHQISASFVDSPWEPEGVTQPRQVDFGRGSDEQFDGYAAVDTVTIRGPYAPGGPGDTPSRRTVFSCRPSGPAPLVNPAKAGHHDESCARRIVTTLARRAYRRPPTGPEIETLLTFYRSGSKQGGFEEGVRAAIERMLVSFNFLFRIERPTSVKATAPLSDLDLASRLSFFLWSTIPDEQLLTLASRGRLSQPAVLEQQVRRMLADPRSRALVDNFAGQWLTMRKAATFQPDLLANPDFDENLRDAFVKEAQLLVDSQLRADRSIVELVTADYSFLNERLARHYGVPNVYGERFRRVTFTDGVRGGVLGLGGVLMVTSYPDRTAPVSRGLWVLDNLLGMPPPPPPGNVPDLEEAGDDGRKRSIREQMEVHRSNPACAACHVRMDPLGFAMEQFDPIGKWRTTSAGLPIDPLATFPDGTRIDGVRGVRTLVTTRRDQYVETFTAKLLTYALGRLVDYRDQPAIRKIAREAAARDHRWSDIIIGIVKSAPFRMTAVPALVTAH
jgi:mono/diheme cytochrome c family protein